jgi:Brp/Blh family beta-carotene 15,15'-monooxygenase
MNYKMHNKIRELGEEHSRYFLAFVVMLILFSIFFPIIEVSFLTIYCFFLIATIGTSHGSLDYKKGEKLLKIYKIKNKSFFYLAYILCACIVIFTWNFLPSFVLITFLLVAAYHFGKEDTQLFLKNNYAKQGVTLYGKNNYFFIIFKGLLVIIAPLFFHDAETVNIFRILDSNLSLHKDFINIFFAIGIYSYFHFSFISNIPTYDSGAVLIDGASILLLNYFFPPLIAFTLYFCFLHSVRHSISLITKLDKKNFKKGTQLFIKKALPLTIITAILFLIAVSSLSSSHELNESILKVIFIGLASLTFPHILLEYLLEKNEK